MTPPAARSAVIGNLTVGAGRPLSIIAGPCVVEGRETTMRIAEQVAQAAHSADVPWIFKASFDKANRTSGKSFRGIGIEPALEVLARVREKLHVPVLTDIHLPDQAALAARYVDVLQIPAFLCRQTDLLLAAAETSKPVNVKKGQFVAPKEMENVVAKLRAAGARDILLTERGTFFGYHRLVNDMTSIAAMAALGVPVVFDATHSVQTPGGSEDRSGGDRRLAPILARAAVSAGADLVFMEVHENPDQALSDGPNSLPTAALERLFVVLRKLRAIALELPPGSELS